MQAHDLVRDFKSPDATVRLLVRVSFMIHFGSWISFTVHRKCVLCHAGFYTATVDRLIRPLAYFSFQMIYLVKIITICIAVSDMRSRVVSTIKV